VFSHETEILLDPSPHLGASARAGQIGQPRNDRTQTLVGGGAENVENFELGAEVRVERTSRQPAGIGDVFDTGARIPALEEQVAGIVEDLLPGLERLRVELPTRFAWLQAAVRPA
jgi:hypothetical protein